MDQQCEVVGGEGAVLVREVLDIVSSCVSNFIPIGNFLAHARTFTDKYWLGWLHMVRAFHDIPGPSHK